MASQDDEEIDDSDTLLADDFTFVKVLQGPVSGQPFKLVSRRRADGPVCGEAVDEIGCGHVNALSLELGVEVRMLHQTQRSVRWEATARRLVPCARFRQPRARCA